MRTLGAYVLTKKLGAGGMGEVWVGQRTALGGASRSVAIKTLLADKAHDETSRKMFLDEARLSMLLTNSNIVQVFDVDETPDGTCYMAMEWIEGFDLSKLYNKLTRAGEQLPLNVIGFITGEILKGLSYAHHLTTTVEGVRKTITIVHRDVTPHNVMVSMSGEVKLMDFGIARMASEETSGVHVKGKLRYMPPEQLRGETREPTIDLFAVGAILHELLEGKKFRADVVDEARLYGMILDGEVPPLTRASELPSELVELCRGLLAAKPDERLSTAREAYQLLATWSGYRDAKFELADLMARFAEPEEIPATTLLPVENLPTGTSSRPDGSQTDLSRANMATSSAPEAPTEVQPRPANNTNKGLAIALVTVSACFALFGAGSMLGWFNNEPAAEQQAAQQPLPPETEMRTGPAPEATPPKSIPPESPPADEEGPKPLPLEAETTGPSSDTTSVSEPEPEPEPEKPAHEPPKKTKKTSVKLTAPGYKFYLGLRINGKVFEFGLNAKSHKISLKPGKVKIEYRESSNGVWRSAGTHEIPPGKASLEFRSGAKVVIK